MNLELSRRKLARIRCIQHCIDCFKANTPLPECLCYVPAEVRFKCTSKIKITVYTERSISSNSKPNTKIPVAVGTIIVASGEEFCNYQGQWISVLKVLSPDKDAPVIHSFDCDKAWVLLYNSQSLPDEDPQFLVNIEEDTSLTNEELVFGKKPRPVNGLVEVIEAKYALQLGKPPVVEPAHQGAVKRLQDIPPNWSLEFDEELARFLSDHREPVNEHLGAIRNYVESVDVSSFCDDDRSRNLTDGESDTYWESDGNQGAHWIRMKMKKGTIIKKLYVTLNGFDDNYLPTHIIVMGGDLDNLKKLSDTQIDINFSDTKDVAILEDMTEHYPFIEIRIKECKDDGIDCRVHGIKIKSSKERDVGLSQDLFTSQELIRFPKLEGFTSDQLYRRSLCLLRFIDLLDTVMQLMVPSWEYSVGSYRSLQVVKQLLTLSKRRNALITTFCRESETGRPDRMPKLYINRRTAADHKQDPSLDPEYKNSVFSQIYEGLKPRDRFEKPLDYRWGTRFDQWWECKFLSEGIIDQGGGFRDSLSDLADELCPSNMDDPVPLPFFVRAPNQTHEDSNVNRDVYVPNPLCTEHAKYHWIGQVMGACLRGKENLVLSLPSFIWKKLVGEPVTWSRDYYTVDAAEVKLTENMELMDEETFEAHFNEKTWTATLSDGSVIPLKEKGFEMPVKYEERHEFIQALQEARINECTKQIESIRGGLLSVVPQAVFDLLTWQEMERWICGDPDITLEALRRSTHYEDLDQSDPRVKYMWDALTNFSNEDRSRFLRFVTGRRRLPAPLYICPDKGDSSDALPESSTCSNTLYLPNYSSAKLAEEKLRYAAYNCIAIDTDMSPWDE